MTTQPESKTPRTDSLLDKRGSIRILPNDSNINGWSSHDMFAFLEHARTLELELNELRGLADSVAGYSRHMRNCAIYFDKPCSCEYKQALTAYQQFLERTKR